MKKEDYFISLFDKKYIGDDACVVDNFVVSKDLFCEDIHFKREWMSLEEIARKSMLINISDAIVMNAKPRYALIGIKIPKSFSAKELKEIFKGFDKICKEYGIAVIGGDTIGGDRLDISVTLLSKTKKAIYRRGVKKGYLLAYTGSLGEVSKELKKAQRGVKLTKNSKFVSPKLKDKFFYEASGYIKSALDISDGLFKDLSRLSIINRVGFKFFKKFPKRVGCSGEEYEILFAFDKKDKKKLLSISKKTKTPITIFAKAKRGKFASICKENHF